MKSLITILISLLLLQACYWKNKDVIVPPNYISLSNDSFETRGGITYFAGQLFSGWQFSLNEIGDTIMLIPFIDGKINGIVKQWYDARRTREIGFFTEGKKSGEHKGWWDNGQLKFIHHYKNDLFEGSRLEWYANGNSYKKMNYVNGQEKGLQQVWRPDGRLHANYEVRNGRNYGLTGNMHCKNIWKDGK